MAEKRVSVRLAAVGGKQVKAELTGIGDAGKKGFGKASREMEIANAKLAKFARRSKIAFGIMTAAAAAAGIAMVRSSLKTIDEQAKLAASLRTTTASMQVLSRAAELAGVSQGEVEQATIMMTKSLSQAAQGTGPAVKALKALNLSAADLSKLPIDAKMIEIQDAIAKFIPTAQQAAVASQIFGARAGLIFTRIDSSTLRQASKDLEDFGVKVSEVDSAQIQRTNDALSRMGLLWHGISNQLAVAVAPALQATADAFARFGNVTGPLGRAIKVLGDNIEIITVAAGSLATFMAGRFVFAMTAAAIGITRVGNAFVFTRAALIRTGLGAVAVAIGEIAFRYDLLGVSAKKTTSAQNQLNDALNLYAESRAPAAKQAAIDAANAYINSARAKLVDTAALILSLEAEISDFNKQNPIQQGLLTGDLVKNQISEELADAHAKAQKLQDGITMVSEKLADLTAKGKEVPPVINAAVRAANSLGDSLAITKAHAVELAAALAQAPGALQGMQKQAAILDAGLAAAAKGGTAAVISTAQFRRQLEIELGLADAAGAAENAYISAIINRRVAEHDANAERQAALNKYLASLVKTGNAAGKTGSNISAAADIAKNAWDAASISLKDYSISSMDISKGVSDSLTRGFKSMEGAFKEFVKTGKTDFSSLVSSMLADLALLEFKKGVLGPIADFLSFSFGGFSSGMTNISGSVMHAGGLVGAGGPSRMLPSMAFAGAPRMHNGGWAGIKPGEVPAILQRGERVLSRREVASGGSGSSAPLQIELRLSGDLDARIAREARGVAVTVVRAGIDSFSNEALPHRVHQIARDGKAIG